MGRYGKLTNALAAMSLAGALAAQAAEPQAAASGRLGGATTITDSSANAFGFPSPLLSAKDRRQFLVGNSFFKQNWVATPSSAPDRDGLGPLFNARSCSSCHLRDGRSAPPAPMDVDRQGLLLRIGVREEAGADREHPVYGGQIQDVAIHGHVAEAQVLIECQTVQGSYGDGTPFALQQPSYSLGDPAYGPPGDDAVLGARTAPVLIGLGLLEAIPVEQLHAWADPDDRDQDGVSGRVHFVGNGARPAIGRFGWKATQPTVEAQVAAAFVNDIGVTSSLFPREVLTKPQLERTRFVAEDRPEVDDATLARVVFYTRALAVPAQRTRTAPIVVAGRKLFIEFGCAACHRDSATTGPAFHERHAGIEFAPFTDLLLHDLGPGLADGKRDGDAAPAEWRTPPLWGIGLLPLVNGHTRLLHDGRARDLAEAVLWHGGEAERARERFRTAPPEQRDELLAFLRSL